MHRGDTWLVESLDLDDHVAVIARADPDYSTTAREITDIPIVAEREGRDWGACRLSLGDVEVSHQVVSYLKRRQPGGEVVGEEPLDLPVRTLRTTAVWWTVPDHVLLESGLARDRPAPARPTPPSTARSGCCRSSRPATAGTSAASPRSCTPTPAA